MQTCRFCGKWEEGRWGFIKYAVRHYAHPDCALRKLGTTFFDRLRPWQIRAFPVLAACSVGKEMYEALKARPEHSSTDN